MVLPYINMHLPRVYTCSPSWTSIPIPSLWVIPVHQPQTSCILHRTWTGDSFLIWYIIHASMPFSPVIPPSPSPTESKRLFYTSVSLLLSRNTKETRIERDTCTPMIISFLSLLRNKWMTYCGSVGDMVSYWMCKRWSIHQRTNTQKRKKHTLCVQNYVDREEFELL